MKSHSFKTKEKIRRAALKRYYEHPELREKMGRVLGEGRDRRFAVKCSVRGTDVWFKGKSLTLFEKDPEAFDYLCLLFKEETPRAIARQFASFYHLVPDPINRKVHFDALKARQP